MGPDLAWAREGWVAGVRRSAPGAAKGLPDPQTAIGVSPRPICTRVVLAWAAGAVCEVEVIRGRALGAGGWSARRGPGL